jgi:hypothetical protein
MNESGRWPAKLAAIVILAACIAALAGTARAVLYCNVAQGGTGLVIFRMLYPSNSHAELYNGTQGYPYDVNCSSLVALNRDCGQAVLMKLNGETNAHAEFGNLSNFDYPVCLSAGTNGVVYCTYASGQPSGYDTCVASFSGETNAHVGDCVTAPFDDRAYCGIAYTPNITSAGCRYNSTSGYHCVVAFSMSGNPSGAEHYINETTGNAGGSSQDWTSSTADYIDAGISAHTQYCYTIKARRLAGIETAYSGQVCNVTENVPPGKINLSYPASGDNQFINRTPRFNWTQGTDQDGDSLTYQLQLSLNPDCSGPLINETGITNNYYQQTSELDFAKYYWRVRAHDPYEYGEWSDIWNFTLVTYVELNITNRLVEFGMMAPEEANDTADGNPQPLRMENIGNTETNVSVNATSLWSSASLDTRYYQFKANRTAGQNSFNWGLSRTTYENISSGRKLAIAYLNHTDLNNEAALDLRIEVSQDESPGAKNSTIEFYAESS